MRDQYATLIRDDPSPGQPIGLPWASIPHHTVRQLYPRWDSSGTCGHGEGSVVPISSDQSACRNQHTSELC